MVVENIKEITKADNFQLQVIIESALEELHKRDGIEKPLQSIGHFLESKMNNYAFGDIEKEVTTFWNTLVKKFFSYEKYKKER